ncbi:hypothetical protein E3Q00_01221 [Wallemia mellicola]|nr:hypothetical protein E3Q00_01221 [Wallemia mellicola]
MTSANDEQTLNRVFSLDKPYTPTTPSFSTTPRISSRQMLNNALSLANTAVNLDKDNDFPKALHAYKDAMDLLENVMRRVEAENSTNSSQQKPTSRRLEEARRLKIIHETYKDRIRLLEVLLDTNEVQKALVNSPIDEKSELENKPPQNQSSPTSSVSLPHKTASSDSHLNSKSMHTPSIEFTQVSPQQPKTRHVTTPSISIQPGSPLEPPVSTERSDSNQTLTDSPRRPPMNRSRSSSTNSSYKLPTRTSSMASLSEKHQIVPLINSSVGEGSLLQRRQANKSNETELFETETTKAFKLDTLDSQRPQNNTAGRLRAISQPNTRTSVSLSRNQSIPPSLPLNTINDNRNINLTQNIDRINLFKTLSNNLYATSEPIIPDPPSRGKPSFDWYHSDPTRRPFQLMKLLAKSIREGAYISPRLYVSPQIWLDSRNVVKLNHIEVKVKSLETILEGLFEVYTIGKNFVQSQVEDEIFLNALWGFNKTLDEVQNQLEKKLDLSSYSNNNFSPTQSSTNNKSSNWTTKLSRSLGVSNGRKTEEGWLYAYIDLLNKVFVNAQVLDVHFGYLQNDVYELYKDSTIEIRHSIAKSLQQSSIIFSRSICKFVLTDLDVLIGKWTKRSHGVDN